MAVPNIVPRNNDDGETLGTPIKQWSNVYTKDVTVNDISLLNKIINFDSTLEEHAGSISALNDNKLDKSTYDSKMAALDEAVSSLSSGKVDKGSDIKATGTGGESVSLYVKDNGARGVYDTQLAKWLIYINNDTNLANLQTSPPSDDDSTKIATTHFVNGGNVVASGTNYIRYANGLQICWDAKNFTNLTYAASGTLFRVAITNAFTFPVVFTTAPTVAAVVQSTNTSTYYACVTSCIRDITGITTLSLEKASASSNVSTSVGYVAIGRWK